MSRLLSALAWSPEFLVITSARTTHALVRDGERRGKRMILAISLVRGAVVGCSMVYMFRHGSLDSLPWVALVVALMGFCTWTTLPVVSSVLYMHAWMDCRRDTVERLMDSDTPMEFVQSMQVYDAVHVLGLPIDVPDSPEGLDE